MLVSAVLLFLVLDAIFLFDSSVCVCVALELELVDGCP